MSQAPHHLLNLKNIRTFFDFKVSASWVSACLDRVVITFKKYLVSLLFVSRNHSHVQTLLAPGISVSYDHSGF